MDTLSESRLGDVYPELAQRIRQMALMLEVGNLHIRVIQALRSWNQQQALWQEGRDLQGNVIGKTVTNAKPGHSWHNFGLAVDIAPFDAGQPNWNISSPEWQKSISCGISLGLTAGAEFRTFPDYPHFQMTGRLPVSPNDEVRQLFKDGGTVAVWDAAFKSLSS